MTKDEYYKVLYKLSFVSEQLASLAETIENLAIKLHDGAEEAAKEENGHTDQD